MKIFWGIVVIVVSLAVLVFSSMSIYEQFIQYDEWWEASVATFGVLGILLTAGAAFATVAAVISYFSVNDKLKKAEDDLNIAKESLANFKKLDDERKTLEDANNQLKEYKAAVQGLESQDATDNSDLQKHIEFVLESPNALFQDRLRANAIKSDIEAKEKRESGEYEQSLNFSLDSMEYWKLLFLYNPEYNVSNYAKSKFNLAYCYSRSCYKNDQYICQLYNDIITLSEKYCIRESLIRTAYYNLGICLNRQAKTIKSSDLNKAVELWKLACEKYAKAIEFKRDYYKAYNNWGNAIMNQAKAIQTGNLAEARKLWALAYEKYSKAISIKHDYYKAYDSWGESLADEASAIQDSNLTEARKLWALAYKKYSKAISIKYDYYKAYFDWARALSNEANAIELDSPEDAKKLREESKELEEKIIELRKKYNE